MDLGNIINDLKIKGISIINQTMNDDELLSFAKKIGQVVPDDKGFNIQDVKAREKQQGTKDSFSYNFGFDCFPYHTDTAFWAFPARYLMLKVTEASPCNTYYTLFEKLFLVSKEEKLHKYIKRASFIVRTFSEQKFASFTFSCDDDFGYRYDPNIMIPYNLEAKELLKIIENSLEKQVADEIKWTGNNIAIIDNWKGIHSRGNSSDHKNRILKRIYIK